MLTLLFKVAVLSFNLISTPVIAYNQKYVSIPQELKISINKNGAKRYLSFLGSDMNVDI